jgi:co-chaperonin GroES (HSP10)
MTLTQNIKPIKKVLISIDKALNDEIITEGGLKLYLDPSYDPSFHATVTGTVKGIPTNPTKEDKSIVSQLRIGDEIAFNYKVVINREYKSNSESFQSVEKNPAKRVFLNNKRQKIMVNALPYRGKVIWVGVLLDHKNNVLDGRQGTNKEIEKWLSNFTFGEGASFVYKNLLEYDDINLWQTEAINIYAKKTSNGIVSLGDRVIMKPIFIDVTQQVKIMKGIHLPDNAVMTEYVDMAVVVSGGERIGINKGDTVMFDPLYIEKYRFFNEDYLLIKEKRIHAICQKETSTKFMV